MQERVGAMRKPVGARRCKPDAADSDNTTIAARSISDVTDYLLVGEHVSSRRSYR